MTTEAHPNIQRIGAVCLRVGLSISAIYDRLDTKSPRYDSSFPRQVNLGSGAVGWLEHEVSAWLLARVAERDTGADTLHAGGRAQRAKHARAVATPRSSTRISPPSSSPEVE